MTSELKPQLTGLHHLTAITADAPGNRRFYTDTLGSRKPSIRMTPAHIICSMPMGWHLRGLTLPFSIGPSIVNGAAHTVFRGQDCA